MSLYLISFLKAAAGRLAHMLFDGNIFLHLPDEDGKIVHWPPPPKTEVTRTTSAGESVEVVQNLESNNESRLVVVSSHAKYSSKFNGNSNSQQMDRPRTTLASGM